MPMRPFILASALALGAGQATAECSFQNDTPVKMLSAGFEAWKAVADAMAECGNFEAELDQEFRTKQSAAMAARPSLYHIGGVSNGTITPLVNQNLVRPLDDLVERFGQDLQPNQLIRIDGEIVAIAMMVNTQYLMYREDILADLDIEVPQTWNEVLAAAEKIDEADAVAYPLGATMKSGWDVAQDYVNMFYGFGGRFVDASNRPTLNNEAGVNALEMMKRMTEYMDPEFLVSDSTYVQQQFQQSRIAMANLWASRANAMNNEAESDVAGQVASAAAPKAMPDGPPATTIWWDGLVIARNISDAEAEASFKLILEALDRELTEDHNDVAIWLVEGYEPAPIVQGAIESMTADPGPPAYPSTAAMGLMHSALGTGIPDFLNGRKDAETTLEDIEAAYLSAAREAGLISG